MVIEYDCEAHSSYEYERIKFALPTLVEVNSNSILLLGPTCCELLSLSGSCSNLHREPDIPVPVIQGLL